jgi:spore maturation protein SpmA
MMNIIWVAMLLAALVFGALMGKLDGVALASTRSAGQAVDLAIGLIGVMALFLGLMQVLYRGGLLRAITRALRPLLTWLFPGVPADHPAMGMMILNITSNMLGLANAATPFGIKAMMELDKLNRDKGTATDAMALFLAINTSELALIPSGIIGLRASLGSTAPGSIFVTTILATSVSTVVAIVAAKSMQRLRAFAVPSAPQPAKTTKVAEERPAAELPDTSAAEATIAAGGTHATWLARVLGWLLVVVVLAALGYALYDRSLTLEDGMPLGLAGSLKSAISKWPLLLVIGSIVLYGVLRGVRVYDAVVDGGREGFQVAVRIIPYLVAILVAVGMLRASGGLDLIVDMLAPLTGLIGMPAEVLPMAILRPLSGTGAFGLAAEIMQTHGPDSLVGQIVSTMQGSTETTFYVLAVYFGAIGVRNVRHTLAACLSADVAGAIAAVWVCRLLLV